jgi:hypothetical protein
MRSRVEVAVYCSGAGFAGVWAAAEEATETAVAGAVKKSGNDARRCSVPLIAAAPYGQA